MNAQSLSHDHYKNIERASRELLQEHQLKSLYQLLETVFERNSFFRKKWLNAGMEDWRDISSLEDFTQLPFTMRDELSADQANHPPYGSNLTCPIENYTYWHRTSSKERPLIVLSTSDDWKKQAETWCYSYAGVNIKPGDSIFIAFSFGPFQGLWNAVTGAEMAGVMMIPGGGMRTLQRIQMIMKYNPTVVICIPSYALRMVEVAQENNIDLGGSGVRVLIHGGEPGPSIPSIRARIEDAWQAKSYDSTGLSEAGHHGFECLAQNGVHIIESEFFVEILKPGTSKPVPDGEVGEMVVTPLGKLGMPVIRYRTGDLVKFTRDPCECGRTFGRLDGGILSRMDGMITIRGINVYPTAIEDCLMSNPLVTEFQVEIFDKLGMKEILVQVETTLPDLSGTEAQCVTDKISQELYQRLSLRADVEVVSRGSLPRKLGKAKRFKFIS